jgi:osmotically-inducible protein OsmY
MASSRTSLALVLAVLTALPLLGCAGTEKQQSTGEFIDDSAITTKVKTKLFDDPVTSGFTIRVSTYRGTVQLSGFVNSEREKNRAGELAQAVAGVKSVKNDLIVK